MRTIVRLSSQSKGTEDIHEDGRLTPKTLRP